MCVKQVLSMYTHTHTHTHTHRVILYDCRGFNNLSYTIHLRLEYVVAPMDQEILKVFYNVYNKNLECYSIK